MPEKPTFDTAPDDCEYTDCDSNPTSVVRFRDPEEYVCYCVEHANKANQLPGAKYHSSLRY